MHSYAFARTVPFLPGVVASAYRSAAAGTGDWADEYLHNGYVLYDQLLYLQAQRTMERMHAEVHGSRATIYCWREFTGCGT
ncbi:MAG: hypothetical protein PVH54_00550 [Gammaproteobacteria bacterium]|jgi:hypothetical protein